MAADAFYLLNYIDCIDDEEQTLPENRLDARHSSSGGLEIDFPPSVDRRPASPINTHSRALGSAPVVFRCAAQTLGLETFFFFCCCCCCDSSFCWPDFYKLMECVLRILLFLLPLLLAAPSDIYIYSGFQTFRPENWRFAMILRLGGRLTLNFSQQQHSSHTSCRRRRHAVPSVKRCLCCWAPSKG